MTDVDPTTPVRHFFFVLALRGGDCGDNREEGEAPPADGEGGEEGASAPPPPGLAFSLRVRRASTSTTSELSRLLGGRTRPGGAPLIEVSSLVDGIVAIELEDDAAAFAERLGGSFSASAVGAASSHELFRATGDAKGVVVLVRRPKEEEEEGGGGGEGRRRRRQRDDDGGNRSQSRRLSPLLGPLPDLSALAAALKAGKQGEMEP